VTASSTALVDGSSIEGFTRIHESDMFLEPDLTTFQVSPFERGANTTTARIICTSYSRTVSPFRAIRADLEAAARACPQVGFVYNTGPELEFFLFKRDAEGEVLPLPHDMGGYFDLTADLGGRISAGDGEHPGRARISVETSHHEVAIAQHRDRLHL